MAGVVGRYVIRRLDGRLAVVAGWDAARHSDVARIDDVRVEGVETRAATLMLWLGPGFGNCRWWMPSRTQSVSTR